MQTTKITLITISALIIAACTAHKKSTTTPSVAKAEAAPSTPSVTVASPIGPAGPANPTVKSPDGVYAPGNEELTALKAKYPNLKDASLEKLQQGHLIYTKGACIKCHGADNIYRHDELQWSRIIGDMALRARLSDAEKDAVFNYVIAIKASQTK